MLASVANVRVDLSDDPERGGNAEDRRDLVLFDDAEILTGVGRSVGLALVHEARASVKQRTVRDVAVTDDPSQVARRPPNVVRLASVERRHCVHQRHEVPAGRSLNSLRRVCRSRRVKYVQGVICLDRNTVNRLGKCFFPANVDQRVQLGDEDVLALENDAFVGFPC